MTKRLFPVVITFGQQIWQIKIYHGFGKRQQQSGCILDGEF
jgi:hypothetical protein